MINEEGEAGLNIHSVEGFPSYGPFLHALECGWNNESHVSLGLPTYGPQDCRRRVGDIGSVWVGLQ